MILFSGVSGSRTACATAPFPFPLESLIMTKGAFFHPLPDLVRSTARRFPLGPMIALAVAPLPVPPKISTLGGPLSEGPVSHDPP